MLGILSNNILTRAFWGDEAWTTLISSLPIPEMIKTTAADFHPPLFYAIIHFWMQIFGNSEVSVRTVSLIFWLSTGGVVYFFARSLKFSAYFRLVAIILVLFNPFYFSYAFEARSYTLFVLASLASMWQFYEVVKNRRGNLFYLLFTTVGLYTHYYMFFVVAAQGLFVLLFRRDLIKKLAVLGLILFAIYLPWLPALLSQGKSVAGGYWIPPANWDTVLGTFLVLIRGEQRTIFFKLIPYLFVVLFVYTSARAWLGKRLFNGETALFSIWFLVPFITPLVISFYRPIFFYRYLIFLVVPLMILPLYWLVGKKINLLQAIIFLMMICIYIYTDFVSFISRTEQLFKPVLADVHAHFQKGEAIYTVLPSFAETVYYNNYDGRPVPVKVIPVGLAQASGKALLDTYVRLGFLTLENPPAKGKYWLLEPGPTYRFIDNK